MKGINDVASKNSGDCDKFGTELEKYLKENASTFKEIDKHMSTLTPEEKKKFDEATGANKDEDPMDVTMKKCRDNANVEKAMKAFFELTDKSGKGTNEASDGDKPAKKKGEEGVMDEK